MSWLPTKLTNFTEVSPSWEATCCEEGWNVSVSQFSQLGEYWITQSRLTYCGHQMNWALIKWLWGQKEWLLGCCACALLCSTVWETENSIYSNSCKIVRMARMVQRLGYGLSWKIWVPFQARQDFSLLHSVKTSCGSHPHSYLIDPGGSPSKEYNAHGLKLTT
jgi:hypothetical protein